MVTRDLRALHERRKPCKVHRQKKGGHYLEVECGGLRQHFGDPGWPALTCNRYHLTLTVYHTSLRPKTLYKRFCYLSRVSR